MTIGRWTRPARRVRAAAALAATAVTLAACSTAVGGADDTAEPLPASWDEVVAEARGQEVALWMWGGD